jgi:hypothetical protein
MLLEGGLWMAVDLAAPPGHLGMKLGNPIDDRHDRQPFSTTLL